MCVYAVISSGISLRLLGNNSLSDSVALRILLFYFNYDEQFLLKANVASG